MLAGSLEHRLARLSGSIRDCGDFIKRLHDARHLRESATNADEIIAYALVEAALRQTLKAIPQSAVGPLFQRLIGLRAYPEARLLVFRAEQPSLRLGMLEILVAEARKSIDRNELSRLRDRYGPVPAAPPTTFVDTKRPETLEAWLARTEGHPERRTVKTALALAEPTRATEQRLRKVPSLQDVAAVVAGLLTGELPDLESFNRSRLQLLADAFLDAGRPIPVPLADRVLHEGLMPYTAARDPAALPALSRKLESLELGARLTLISRFLRFGGDVRALAARSAAIRASVVDAWVNHVLDAQSAREARERMRELLVLSADEPRTHRAHHDALVAAIDGAAPPEDHSLWLAGRRSGRSYRRAMEHMPSRIADLEALSDPVAAIDLLLDRFLPELGRPERASAFAAVMRRVAGTTVGPVAHAATRWIRSGQLSPHGARRLRNAMVFVEALVYRVHDAQLQYAQLAEALARTSSKVAFSLAEHLPDPAERRRLQLALAYRSGTAAQLLTTGRKVGAGYLTAAIAELRARRFDAAADALFRDARRARNSVEDLWWVLSACVLASREPRLALQHLEPDLIVGGSLSADLFASWLRAAGYQEAGTPSSAVVPTLLSADRRAAENALWTLVGRSPAIDVPLRSMTRALPWLEREVLRSIREGRSLSPSQQAQLLHDAGTPDDLRAVFDAPGLGMHSQGFLRDLVSRLIAIGGDDSLIADVRALPLLDAPLRLDLALASSAADDLASAIRQAELVDLATRWPRLMERLVQLPSSAAVGALREKSRLMALPLDVRPPTSPAARTELRECLTKALQELDRWKTDDEDARALQGWTVTLSRSASESYQDMCRSAPDTARAFRGDLRRALVSADRSAFRTKVGSPLLGMGQRKDQFRALVELERTTLHIHRILQVAAHDEYDRLLNDKDAPARLRAEAHDSINIEEFLQMRRME